MAAPKTIWAEFAGLGYIAGPFASSVISGAALISGDVYTVTMLWSDIYGDNQLMIDNVGAQVYVEGYANRNVPDGYYTITGATTISATITGTFSSAPSAGAPTSAATIRIEDFYKICTDIPDFVTGDAARARWVPSILEDGFTATLGQKIDVRGSVASFDGFSLSYALPNQVTAAQALDANTSAVYTELQKILRTAPTFVEAYSLTDSDDAIVVVSEDIEYTDALIEKKGTDTINAAFVASDVAYNNRPAMVDREAIIIFESAGGTPNLRYDVIREVLGTEAEFHQTNGPVYEGLQTGQAATVRVKKADKDILTYSIQADYTDVVDAGLIYIGIVENIKISSGSSKVNIELSPQLFVAAKNSAGDKLATVGKVESYEGLETRWALKMDSRFSVLPWEWMKLGPLGIRLRQPTDPAVNTNKAIRPGVPGSWTGIYDTLTAIDDIAWDPDYPGYNDNHVILDLSESEEEFKKRSRTWPRATGTAPTIVGGIEEADREVILQTDRDSLTMQNVDSSADILLNRDGIASSTVVHIDIQKLVDEKAEPCHIFQSSVFTTELNEDNLYTESYRSYITLFDVILQILTSKNGDGANGFFDVLPAGLGLGISTNAIDWDSFGWDPVGNVATYSTVSESKRFLILQNVVMTAKDTEKFNEWLTKKILQPVNLSLIQTDAGKVSLVDMTNYLRNDSLTTIDEDNIEYDFGTKNLLVSQTYDAKQLFDRIIGTTSNPTVSPTSGQTAEVITVPNLGSGLAGEDFDELTIKAQLFTFIQAEPLKYEHPFLVGSQSSVTDSQRLLSATSAMSQFSSDFAGKYGKIIPGISFTARQDLVEIGEKFQYDIDNIIGSDGSIGILGVAIVVDKQTNILAEQSRYECIVLDDVENVSSVWSASAEVESGSTITTINVSSDSYTTALTAIAGWTEDVNGFTAGDHILLYDENFILLSVDGGGNADPKIIDSISQGAPDAIVMVSPFTDGAGASITAAAGNIIMLADYSLQSATVQDQQSWFGRTQNQ